MAADIGSPRLTDRLAVASHIRSAEVDGEVVIYDPVREEVHRLDPVASAFWSLVDGTHTLEWICGQLADRFQAPAHRVSSDVVTLVSELSAYGLIAVS